MGEARSIRAVCDPGRYVDRVVIEHGTYALNAPSLLVAGLVGFAMLGSMTPAGLVIFVIL